jgi:hypothetical protein
MCVGVVQCVSGDSLEWSEKMCSSEGLQSCRRFWDERVVDQIECGSATRDSDVLSA